MLNKNKKQLGFTIIELLVVIAIIGLLSSVVLVSLNSARKKARDARRKADLHQIQLALEMYYDANNQYPPSPAGWTYSCDGANWNNLQTALAPYISKLPVDPINTSCGGSWNAGYYTYAYGYPQFDFPQKYDLITALENTNDSDRCAVKKWRYHTAVSAPNPELSWCNMGYWDQLYADH